MTYSVQGKTAIVTGGASGIGFQCCRQLLLNGAKGVAILDLSISNGEASVSKLNEEFGKGKALFFPSDVTKFDEFEGLDVLINNAGILNDATWQKEIETNYTALVKNTLLGYDCMGKHKGGKGGIIVNVSSTAGLLYFTPFPVYTSTKHAILSFTVSLKKHFERTGISVRVMCPGATDTPLVTDPENKYLSFVDSAKISPVVQSLALQPVECVGESMIHIIEKGKNGSVWVSQHSEPPFEIEIAKYESIRA